jgi:hypothetical protein
MGGPPSFSERGGKPFKEGDDLARARRDRPNPFPPTREAERLTPTARTRASGAPFFQTLCQQIPPDCRTSGSTTRIGRPCTSTSKPLGHPKTILTPKWNASATKRSTHPAHPLRLAPHALLSARPRFPGRPWPLRPSRRHLLDSSLFVGQKLPPGRLGAMPGAVPPR